VNSFGDYILCCYEGRTFFDIFKKNGKLIERRYAAGEQSSAVTVTEV